jgi:hypothetical protein
MPARAPAEPVDAHLAPYGLFSNSARLSGTVRIQFVRSRIESAVKNLTGDGSRVCIGMPCFMHDVMIRRNSNARHGS